MGQMKTTVPTAFKKCFPLCLLVIYILLKIAQLATVVLNSLSWFIRTLYIASGLNFEISINSPVNRPYSYYRNQTRERLFRKTTLFSEEKFFTWCLCSPKLCMFHHTDPGPLRAPWLWCSLGPLYYVSVPVLCLCPHSPLCEFFEQLTASVEKKIGTEWILISLCRTLVTKENVMKSENLL